MGTGADPAGGGAVAGSLDFFFASGFAFPMESRLRHRRAKVQDQL